jgi:hypothetical protein
MQNLLSELSTRKVTEINYVEIVERSLELLRDRQMFYFDSLLPLLFNLRGKPFTLLNHFPMRSLFARVLPPQLTYKTGRQVAKSSSAAVHSVFMAGTTPYCNILHVTPLFEMIRKFSSNYVAPLIDDSPVRDMFITPRCNRSVLQRSFRNGSNLIFTFAFNDCTRVRGNTARVIKYDEYQDMDRSFEPIINQTVAAVNAGIDTRDLVALGNAEAPCIMRFGTPLTMENGLEQSWETSSQAEWAIPCRHCKKVNIPSYREDLLKMLGPVRRTVPATVDTPGLVCAKCGGYLYTRDGRWVHGVPERRYTHAGYHIPQIIMPFHCEIPDAWTKLQQSRINRNEMTEAEFFNEVCGESFDHGQKLVSVTEIRRAATLSPWSDMQKHQQDIRAARYVDWGCGIDWGGGGTSGISKTAIAFAGLRSDGIVEVFSGWRSQTPNDFLLEARRAKTLGYSYQCKFFAMDFQSGRARWDRMLEVGVPIKMTMPCSYVRVGAGAITKLVPENKAEREPMHLQINKARSFLSLSLLIRAGKIRFFQYDYKGKDNPGLLNDFTALVEDRTKLKRGSEIYSIIHDEKVGPDDFADAVNYAICCLFHRNGGWPNCGGAPRPDLTDEQLNVIEPKYDTSLDFFLGNEEEQLQLSADDAAIAKKMGLKI